MEVRLDGKVAVVTGAMSGIGLAVTKAFLESGIAGVVAVDRKAETPAELIDCQKRFRKKVALVRGDVGQESTAKEFTRVAVEKFGRLDVFVNNAAVSVVKAIDEHTSEEWDSVMNTNVRALYCAAKYVIPVMKKQKAGLILSTGSISGQVGIPMQGAYAASKGALHQMTRQMAIEYAKDGIRVNAIACGTVDTPIVHESAQASGNAEAFWNMLKANHPIGRIATAAEVAAFFTYMASDLASFFTGSILMMDGGFTAH